MPHGQQHSYKKQRLDKDRRVSTDARWGGQKPIITGPLGEAKDRHTLASKMAEKPKRAA